MSSSKDNNTYKKTSFLVGNNSEFINQFYAEYLSDPKSLPESWRKFFDGLSDEQKLIYNDLKGPSWSPEKKSLKIEFNNIFHVRCFSFVFESITLIMELVNWSRIEPTNEVRFCSILYFIHKIVRKIGQNRYFVKFHPALRNLVLNI